MHICKLCSYTTNKSFNLKRHTACVHRSLENTIAVNRCIDAENRCIDTENRCIDTENRCTESEIRNDTKKIKCSCCYKTFTRSQRLLDHKSKCSGKSHPYECVRCHHILSSFCTLARHKKTCSGTLTCVFPVAKENQVERLEQQVEELKLQLLQHQPPSTNISTGHVNNTSIVGDHNTANIININGIGKEDITFLTNNPRFKSFMTSCIKNQLDGVMEYLEKKHFHPRHPENHNLKKLTKKDSFMECYDGTKWRLRYCDDILHDVFHNMQIAFAEFVETATEDGKLKKVWLDNFMSTVGTPLDWDINCDNYENSDNMTERQKLHLKERLFALAIEHIYKKSKQKHRMGKMTL